jgi:CubicO group peptidase (beta-lactamase class C family)
MQTNLTRRNFLRTAAMGGATLAGSGAMLPSIMTGRVLAEPKRNWTATGTRLPQLDGLDRAMQRAMQAANIRAGTLAVTSLGKILFERGYTWAEPGYPITQPNSIFRLASVGKAFTAALAYELVQAGAIRLDTRVFPYLDLGAFARKGRASDPRLNDITVKNLIDMRSGLPRNTADIRDIAHALGLHRTPTLQEVIGYMLGEPLQFAPGTSESYSNFGYDLLASVCEKAAKTDFFPALRTYVTDRLGVEVFRDRTLKEERLPREVFYEDSGRAPTRLNPDRNDLLPAAYGGDVIVLNGTAGGVVTSASGVARLIGRYAAWGYGGRSPGSSRSGSQPGSTCFASSRPDRLDFCFIFNTREFGEGAGQVNALPEQVDRVLDDSHIGCEAAVFWNFDMKGELWRTTRDHSGLYAGWNDQISSIEIASGNWEFYEHGEFGGRVLKLGPGHYPFLIDGWNDSISSFRCVEATLAR